MVSTGWHGPLSPAWCYVLVNQSGTYQASDNITFHVSFIFTMRNRHAIQHQSQGGRTDCPVKGYSARARLRQRNLSRHARNLAHQSRHQIARQAPVKLRHQLPRRGFVYLEMCRALDLVEHVQVIRQYTRFK